MTTVPISTVEWACREVERQGDPPTFVPYMIRAALYARRVLVPTENAICTINGAVRGIDRAAEYRRTPVTFRDGGSAASAEAIPRQMRDVLCDGAIIDIEQWVQHFLYVHPFEDGNGRTASILRNWHYGTLDNPTDLPEYTFT